MKLKDIKEKYKGYNIIEQGYKDSIPFTCLPKNYKDLEIKGYDVYTKKITNISINHCIFGGKKKPNKTYKGIVYVWYK